MGLFISSGFFLFLFFLLLFLFLFNVVFLWWFSVSITVFKEDIKSIFHFLYFFLLLLFEPLDGGSHIFGHFLLFNFLQSSQSLEVFLFRHFPCEDISHNIFFIFLHRVQRLAKLKDSNSSILISDSSILPSNNLVSTSIGTNFDASEGSIWYLMRKGYLILSVVIIPDIKPSVFSCQEKCADSCGWEAAIAQVTWMISSLHQWCFKIVHPYFSAPVTNWHENLWKLKISSDAVNRTQMSIIEA